MHLPLRRHDRRVAARSRRQATTSRAPATIGRSSGVPCCAREGCMATAVQRDPPQNPHRLAPFTASAPSGPRFPPLKAFGRRPKARSPASAPAQRPTCETLHRSHRSGARAVSPRSATPRPASARRAPQRPPTRPAQPLRRLKIRLRGKCLSRDEQRHSRATPVRSSHRARRRPAARPSAGSPVAHRELALDLEAHHQKEERQQAVVSTA